MQGLDLLPRWAALSAWWAAWLIVAAALLALTACAGSASQDVPQQSDAPQTQPDDSQSDQPSAADAMQRDDQPTDDYSIDPYGEQDTSDEERPETPVPPVRQWLADGVPLTPSVAAELDEYGWSAVIEDDVLAVSAPYHDADGADTGAVFIFERVDGEWVETAYLRPPFPDEHGWFGRWLAIDDGRMVIGAPYEDGRTVDEAWVEDAGAAYVYEKVDGIWSRTGTLLPETPNTSASFGWSVDISGDRIAVAAWEDTVDGVMAGTVTTFRQYKGLWHAEAVLHPDQPTDRQHFGRDIALDDNVLVVGAPGDDTLAEDAGALYVWHFYDEVWNFTARLVAGGSNESDRLGSQVTLDLPWLAAGAHDHDDFEWGGGAVYVWRLDNIWRLDDKLRSSDLQPGDWFGYSVDIKGDRMVVGAPHRAHPETSTFRSGAAYAFELVGGEWVEVGVLGPVDAVLAGERAEFGWVTEIDGTTAVVGAWLADTEAGEDAGAAAVYEIPLNAEAASGG